MIKRSDNLRILLGTYRARETFLDGHNIHGINRSFVVESENVIRILARAPRFP